MDEQTPVYLDAFRESGRAALYSCLAPLAQERRLAQAPAAAGDGSRDRVYWSERDFDVPAQPIDFRTFLSGSVRSRFEQISTAHKDPRFAVAAVGAASQPVSAASSTNNDEQDMLVMPSGGKLVLFDSVTMPHSVLEVTGNRQRIAATGWFHEESQFFFEGVA